MQTLSFQRNLLLAATLLLTVGCVSWLAPKVDTQVTALEPGNYTLDKSHAALIFKVSHLGLSTYVGRFNRLDAELNFDPNNMRESQLSAKVTIDSVDVNDDELAERLKGGNWFDVRSYPEAQFTSTSVEPLGSNRFIFNGDLTIRGITRPIQLEGVFHGGADNILTGKYTLGFSATAQIKRSAFGLDAYLGLVGDQVDLEVYAEFLKR